MDFSTLQGIIGVIFAFSVAIFVHELGHFMFAKLFGVRVETFSIGFGKKLFSFRRGETEYKIAAIPFGGYVKMVGTVSKELEDVLEGRAAATEDERDEAELAARQLNAPASASMAEGIQDEVDALRNKAYWQKILVFVAGCVNNVLTAIFVLFLLYFIGHHREAPPANIYGGSSDLPASVIALQPGDEIVSVNGEPVKNFYDVTDWFTDHKKFEDFKDSNFAFDVVRDGTTMTVELPRVPPVNPPVPDAPVVQIAGVAVDSPEDVFREVAAILNKRTTEPQTLVFKTDDGTTTIQTSAIGALGPWWPVRALTAKSSARVAMVMPNQPAEKAGFQNEDVITRIDGQTIDSTIMATDILARSANKTVTIDVQREDEAGNVTERSIEILVRESPDHPGRGQIGVMFGAERTEFVKYGFVKSLTQAVQRSLDFVTGYWNALKNILSSSFTTIRENLSGPIGISVQFYKIAQSGWVDFFVTFALFNIILALTNLLPLPVLDGGHIMFATIEAIIRRPLPAKFMIAIYNLFTFLIIGLALLITFNDVIMNAWRVIGK